MHDLLRNALRRKLRMARTAGDTDRAEQIQRRLNPVRVAKPAAEVPAPKRRGRPRKEAPTVAVELAPEPTGEAEE